VIVTCRRFVEIITAEQEGALPSWEERHFHEHRDVCGPCRRYLEGFERTVELLHELPRERAPEAMREALLARFRAARGGSTDG
jgi:hypothetical protein